MRRLTLVGPCDAPWEHMRGSGAVRHCASCDRPVHDLSALTEPEALALVVLGDGPSRCVRFTSDARDRIVHAPTSHASALYASLRVGLVAAAAGALASGCASSPVVAPTPAIAAERVRSEAPRAAGSSSSSVGRPAVATAEAPEPTPEPHVRRVVSESQGIMILRYISFPFASRVPNADSKPLVAEIVAVLGKNPQITRVAVVGHASKGEPKPEKLGELRAQAVVAALLAAKVEPARLVVESAGNGAPIADNATPEGRALNRRVQFRIIEAASCPAPGATTP